MLRGRLSGNSYFSDHIYLSALCTSAASKFLNVNMYQQMQASRIIFIKGLFEMCYISAVARPFIHTILQYSPEDLFTRKVRDPLIIM